MSWVLNCLKNLIRTAKNKNLNNVKFYNLDIQSYKKQKI